MVEEKKTTPALEEQRSEPPAPEAPGVPTPPGLEVLTVEEQLILEHEGQAALFEMGEAILDVSELPSVTIPDPPAPEPEAQGVIPDKVIDLSPVRAEAGREQPEPPRRGRRPKNKEAPAQGEKPKRKGRPPKSEKQAPAPSRARACAGGADPAQGRLPWGKGGDRLSGPGPAPPVPEPPVRRPGRYGNERACVVCAGRRRPPARPGASP